MPEHTAIPKTTVYLFNASGSLFRKLKRYTRIPTNIPVANIVNPWWGIFLIVITRRRYARAVPKRPKLIIFGPIVELTMSAAKPIAKELIVASVGSQ